MKKIELEVRGCVAGSAGTLGWLLAEMSHVKIGRTKNGRNAAWLMNKAGDPITILCIQGWGEEDTAGPQSDITMARPYTREHYEDYTELYMDMPFSDAALTVLGRVIVAAGEALWDSVQDEPDPDLFEVILVRGRDKEAAAMSRTMSNDVQALPVLLDRFKEILPEPTPREEVHADATD